MSREGPRVRPAPLRQALPGPSTPMGRFLGLLTYLFRTPYSQAVGAIVTTLHILKKPAQRRQQAQGHTTWNGEQTLGSPASAAWAVGSSPRPPPCLLQLFLTQASCYCCGGRERRRESGLVALEPHFLATSSQLGLQTSVNPSTWPWPVPPAHIAVSHFRHCFFFVFVFGFIPMRKKNSFLTICVWLSRSLFCFVF